jgi:hypothetical protein
LGASTVAGTFAQLIVFGGGTSRGLPERIVRGLCDIPIRREEMSERDMWRDAKPHKRNRNREREGTAKTCRE